ncbi:hypothetical protein YC2023_052910 [Brassica napus]
MAAELFEKAKTGVFRDAEDCKIPSGLNAILVSKNIRSGLKDTCYLGLTSIFAYGSTEDIMVGFDSSADIISRSECPPAVVMNLTEPGELPFN